MIDTVRIGLPALLARLATLAGGVDVGIMASRMFALRWDQATATVVGSIDVVGAVVLVASDTSGPRPPSSRTRKINS